MAMLHVYGLWHGKHDLFTINEKLLWFGSLIARYQIENKKYALFAFMWMGNCLVNAMYCMAKKIPNRQKPKYCIKCSWKK